ncbi:MAG: PorV/PorQ family protein [Elusimicrobia bacterium]|nr:PorV/PorQ family protein [Elusimicrobiota bacterium]
MRATRKTIQKAALVLAVGFASMPGRAASVSADFLRLGNGARAAALGNASTALVNDATAIAWNPAALTRLKTKTATLMHASYLDSAYTYQFAAYGQSVGESLGIGVGVQYLSVGALPQTDLTGTEIGSFSPNDLAVSVGGALDFGGNSVGLTAKWIRSEIVNSAQTVAGDVGVLSAPLWDNRLRLGLVAANLGGGLKYDREKSDLPLVFRAGAALRVKTAWTLTVDAEKPKTGDSVFGGGSEYRWNVGPHWTLTGRLGYSNRAQDIQGVTGVSGGLGVLYKKIQIDYALVPYGDVGLTHLVSLTTYF